MVMIDHLASAIELRPVDEVVVKTGGVTITADTPSTAQVFA